MTSMPNNGSDTEARCGHESWGESKLGMKVLLCEGAARPSRRICLSAGWMEQSRCLMPPLGKCCMLLGHIASMPSGCVGPGMDPTSSLPPGMAPLPCITAQVHHLPSHDCSATCCPSLCIPAQGILLPYLLGWLPCTASLLSRSSTKPWLLRNIPYYPLHPCSWYGIVMPVLLMHPDLSVTYPPPPPPPRG